MAKNTQNQHLVGEKNLCKIFFQGENEAKKDQKKIYQISFWTNEY